jgi:hypothetical protein
VAAPDARIAAPARFSCFGATPGLDELEPVVDFQLQDGRKRRALRHFVVTGPIES